MAPARHRDLDTISFHLVMWALAIVAIVVLIAPTIVVLMVSFTSGFSLKFPPPGYSLRWYVSLLDAWQLHFAATNSFVVAITSTSASIALGVAAALAIAKSETVTARLLDSLFMSPLVLPALAFGLSALMYFSLLGISLSMTTLIIGHIVVCVPYVIRTTVASLAQLDPALLESSASLGGGRLYTFRRVTWPAIRGGVFAGAFIAFMSSFDNVPVSLFLADARSDMLPIRLWQNLEGNLDVRTASVSGVLIAATIILLVIMEKVSGISQKLR